MKKKLTRDQMLFRANLLWPGTRFDTPFEKGCEVVTEPDKDGNFEAYDSERVLCSFSLVMIETIWL